MKYFTYEEITPDASIKEDLNIYRLFLDDQNGLPFTFLKPDLTMSRQHLLCFVETPYMGFGAAIQLNNSEVRRNRRSRPNSDITEKKYPRRHSKFLLAHLHVTSNFIVNAFFIQRTENYQRQEYTIAFQVEVTKKFSLVILTSVLKQHKGSFGTDLVVLNIGQMTRTTPKLARSSPNFRSTAAPSVLLPGLRPCGVSRGGEGVVHYTSGRASGSLRLI
ncbi:hypothetical protein AVEN_39269-1 [Araneus ventricosus]|uniref:Uncharacterized protein n=1 Tax=Araneus ventricosus TaxID=182803 RepID=A0A4Y2MXG1_ARAVE|nr:hypothetical protein AVEN_39269-1 [Araneus ventricosus]